MSARMAGSRFATSVAAVGLVGSLGWWGWAVTDQARDGWWAVGQHVAITPDDQGWAEVDTLRVRLTGVENLTEVDGEAPPEGLAFLALDFEVDAQAAPTLSRCTVEVHDEQGRLFEAGTEVPYADDPYVTSLRCGTSDPEEDPVPARQSMLVLVPADTEPVSVRVDALEFPPARFIELPVTSTD